MLNFLNKLMGNAGPSAEEINDFKSKGATFLDVRTPGEFSMGHIKGAPNIPLQVLPDNINRIKKMKSPILIYCRSGARAGQAMGFLQQHGIEAYNVGGLDYLNQILD